MFAKHFLPWLALLVCCGWPTFVKAAEDDDKALRSSAEGLVSLFNAAKPKELAALFAPQGELIDEHGVVYHGKQEITDLFTKFFAKFPDAKLTVEVESIRTLSDNLAIEEGTRLVTTKEASAQLRYVAVRTKVKDQWLIASLREFSDDPPPTPHDRLAPLGWLVGDWVNEGSDAVVKISYRWSDDANYLLGDYSVVVAGKPTMKSTQRIGWNPVTQKIHSWLFDADGGFSEGVWTPVADGWLVKSNSVITDGRTGSATLRFLPQAKERFTLRGEDRVAGDEQLEDFEVAVIKRIASPAVGSGSGNAGATEPAKKDPS